MKVLAILLLLLGLGMILLLALLYFFGFIMSFDAPGSAANPLAWGMRLLLFLPIGALVVVLYFALVAYRSGDFARAVRFGSVFGLAALGLLFFVVYSEYTAIRDLRSRRAQEQEEAKYPRQVFLRPVTGGADTIIVFPSRLVAYRIFRPGTFAYGGPLGQLNARRDTITLEFTSDTKLSREDLPEFRDAAGQRFTEAFVLR